MRKTVAITGVWMVLAISPLFAQSRKDPLTDQQIEDVREAGDEPVQRIKLFVGYVEERVNGIHSLTTEAGAQNRAARMHNLLDEFTRLSDDLEDNMDNFNDEHADLRKVLKEIVDKSGQWGTVLNQPPPSNQYDFVRKTALDANQSVHEAAVQMLADQEKYFIEKEEGRKGSREGRREGSGKFRNQVTALVSLLCNPVCLRSKSCYAESGEFRIAVAICRRVPCPSATGSHPFSGDSFPPLHQPQHHHPFARGASACALIGSAGGRAGKRAAGHRPYPAGQALPQAAECRANQSLSQVCFQ